MPRLQKKASRQFAKEHHAAQLGRSAAQKAVMGTPGKGHPHGDWHFSPNKIVSAAERQKHLRAAEKIISSVEHRVRQLAAQKLERMDQLEMARSRHRIVRKLAVSFAQHRLKWTEKRLEKEQKELHSLWNGLLEMRERHQHMLHGERMGAQRHVEAANAQIEAAYERYERKIIPIRNEVHAHLDKIIKPHLNRLIGASSDDYLANQYEFSIARLQELTLPYHIDAYVGEIAKLKRALAKNDYPRAVWILSGLQQIGGTIGRKKKAA